MEFTKKSELNRFQKAGILKIWNNEYPDFFTYKNITEFEDYLDKLNNTEQKSHVETSVLNIINDSLIIEIRVIHNL